MLKDLYPILEFDEDKSAVLRPELIVQDVGAPHNCILCFFPQAIAMVLERYPHRVIGEIVSEDVRLPVYAVEYEGRTLCLVQARVGGPCAASQMEELYAMGCRRFLACGSCGALDQSLAVGHVVIPTAAVRDEGTSYHYLPPSREIVLDEEVAAVIAATLTELGAPHVKGKTWTTDGVYRETRALVAQRIQEGCITVEMECASWAAVARFLGAGFGQLLYAGDMVAGEAWDKRDFGDRHDVRQSLLGLALRVCARM